MSSPDSDPTRNELRYSLKRGGDVTLSMPGIVEKVTQQVMSIPSMSWALSHDS